MIYPLNQAIEELLESAVDEETGELIYTEEELAEKIKGLQLDFDEQIKALRNSYLKDKLDAERVAAESSAIYKYQQEVSKRAKAIENRAERKKRFIAWLLNGDKFDKDGVKISYRSGTVTAIDDGFIGWASVYAPGFLKEPEIDKKAVERALKNGDKVQFARLEDKKYIQIK